MIGLWHLENPRYKKISTLWTRKALTSVERRCTPLVLNYRNLIVITDCTRSRAPIRAGQCTTILNTSRWQKLRGGTYPDRGGRHQIPNYILWEELSRTLWVWQRVQNLRPWIAWCNILNFIYLKSPDYLEILDSLVLYY